MKLYFHPMTRAMTPRLLIAELDLDCEIVDVDFESGEHKTPAHLERHPLGLLPALELDDGSTMWEAAAICLYLAEQKPEAGLHVPPNDPDRGRYLTWCVYGVGSVEPAAMAIYHLRQGGDEASVAAAQRHADAVFAAFADRMGDGPWLLGDRFTTADVIAGMGIGWCAMQGFVKPTGKLGDYLARFNARPAIARVFAQYGLR